MRSAIVILGLIAFLLPGQISAQHFTDIQAKIKKVMHCGGSWIDHDDDGDLDLILTGEYLSGNKRIKTSRFYNNVDRATVFNYFRTTITNVSFSATDVADYDNDGDLDVILTGQNQNGQPVTQLYRNDGDKNFTRVQTNLKNLHRGDVAFTDFDRDGNQDIAICGKDTNGNYHTIVYKNNGNGGFEAFSSNFTGVVDGVLAWGDFDNDGYRDLFVSGQNSKNVAVSNLYEFNNNSFQRINLNLPGRKKSAAAWGDYDNDGDLDLFLTGENNQNQISSVILNNMGGGNFSPVNTSIIGTRSGSADWGDYDHDGDIDLLITGEAPNNQIISRIYRNDRNNTFTNIKTDLIGVYFSDAEWGDYDNDGDLDLFLAGLTQNYKADAKIYRNERIKKQTDQETDQERFSDIPTNKDIWKSTRLPSGRRYTYYYFMVSSCFCRPDSTYQEKDYHVFISEAFKLTLPFYGQSEFFREIIESNENWGAIKGAHPSEGYITMEEAQEGRQKFIKSYEKEGYKIHYVSWNKKETYGQR